MRIWHISDSHGFHEQYKIPDNIDLVIHTGDISNTKSKAHNANECTLFLSWYATLPIKHRILIAGNHDTSIESGLTDMDTWSSAITYLEHKSIEIEGIKIFGSPYTPTYGDGWAFNVKRHKLSDYWAEIPQDTDIIAIHGPCKGILDLSFDKEGNLEYCGCKSLTNKVHEINPKLFLSGHIHNMPGVANAGTRKLHNLNTTFSNASGVLDGKFDYGLINNGSILEI